MRERGVSQVDADLCDIQSGSEVDAELMRHHSPLLFHGIALSLFFLLIREHPFPVHSSLPALSWGQQLMINSFVLFLESFLK